MSLRTPSSRILRSIRPPNCEPASRIHTAIDLSSINRSPGADNDGSENTSDTQTPVLCDYTVPLAGGQMPYLYALRAACAAATWPACLLGPTPSPLSSPFTNTPTRK